MYINTMKENKIHLNINAERGKIRHHEAKHRRDTGIRGSPRPRGYVHQTFFILFIQNESHGATFLLPYICHTFW